MHNFKIEKIIQKVINKIFHQRHREFDDEPSYWDHLWQQRIDYACANKTPYELCNPWIRKFYEVLFSQYINLPSEFLDKKICEFGSGSGILSLMMTREGAKVTLIDYSLKAIEYSRILAGFLGVPKSKVMYYKKDFMCANLEPQSYDMVWMFGVTEHYNWEKGKKIINLAKKICRPKGKVILFIPNLLSPQLIYLMTKFGKGTEIFFSHRMLKQQMQECGFINIHVETINYWVPSFINQKVINLLHKFNICKFFKGLGWISMIVGIKK